MTRKAKKQEDPRVRTRRKAAQVTRNLRQVTNEIDPDAAMLLLLIVDRVSSTCGELFAEIARPAGPRRRPERKVA